MSDDLISRSQLLKQYDLEDCTKYGNKSKDQQRQSYETMHMYEIAEMIEDAPVAFDLYKVLEELKNKVKEYERKANEAYESNNIAEYTVNLIARNACLSCIRIVKSGITESGKE